MPLPPKDPQEIIIVTIDYSRVLNVGETILIMASQNVTVVNGTDPNPTAIVAASATWNTTQVLCPVWNGLAGVTYKIETIVATTTGRRLAGVAELPVENA